MRVDRPSRSLVDVEWWPGFASAYRGRGVSVSWRKGLVMQHVTWEPPEHVRRPGRPESNARSEVGVMLG